jgi:hypothetical protein
LIRVDAGWVELPTALLRKYPNVDWELAWQWVFPPPGSTGIGSRPAAAPPSARDSPERAVKDAVPPGGARQAGQSPTHFGTRSRHLPEDGHDICTVQELLGHRDEHDDDLHARVESWAGRGAKPGGPDVHSVTWPAASARSTAGLRGPSSPSPPGTILTDEREGESRGLEVDERSIPGRDGRQDLAAVTVLRWSAYPVAEL